MIPKILLIVFAVSFFISPAFSQSLLEVTTSEKVYFEGDVIVISGNVSTVIQDTPVTIQIIRLGENNEESIVQIAQIEVAQDGTFSHTVKAEGPQWKTEGEYVVRAFYGIDSIADVYFDFFKKDQEVKLIFEVENPDQSGTFDIEYSIRGGNVTDIIVDQEFFELIVLIEPKSDGAITLELPRTAIDAKKSDGTDDIFIILIDGIEVPFTETQNDANTRSVTIEFEETDSDIEIIGTFVIPEFGTITSLVLAVSIISIIIISSKRDLARL
jgi:predicted secreted protein with PEFG-CTERM motif